MARRYKVCLTGKYGVGKTTIFARVQGKTEMKSEYDDYDYEVQDPKPIKIKLVDTAGMEHHNSLSFGPFYRNAVCLIFVVDVTDIETLHYIGKEYKSIQEKHYCDDARVIILLNKADLKFDRVVKKEDIDCFLDNNHKFRRNLKYLIEISALNDTNVIENFFKKTLVELLLSIDDEERAPVKTFELARQPNTTTDNSCCFST